MIYNLIGRATVWYARQYIGRRVPRSTILVALAAVAGIIVLAGGAAVTTGSKTGSNSDY